VSKFDLRLAVAVTILIGAVLTPLTWARNADWASDTRLFETDYRRLRDKYPILNTLLAAQLAAHNTARAVELCDEHVARVLSGASIGIHCGTAYGKVGRWEDAEQALIAAGTGAEATARPYAHMNLAMLYLHRDRRGEAATRFELALASQKKLFLREYFSAVMLLQLYPDDRAQWLAARGHLERAIRLQPDHAATRTELDELNQKLRATE
jgi:tetratricopeptide (TPR) repeat protein